MEHARTRVSGSVVVDFWIVWVCGWDVWLCDRGLVVAAAARAAT